MKKYIRILFLNRFNNSNNQNNIDFKRGKLEKGTRRFWWWMSIHLPDAAKRRPDGARMGARVPSVHGASTGQDRA